MYITSGGITGTPASLQTGWSLVNGYLIGPYSSLSGANLSAVDLTGSNLSDAVLTNADLSGANLTNVNFVGADLGGANFTGADITGVEWAGAICPDGTTAQSNGNTCANNL